MKKYKGVTCSICNKPLEDKTVVVCPDCGAPFHLDCYKEIGHCIFEDKHQDGYEWQSPINENETENNSDSKDENAICPQCKNENNENALFCEKCGFPLNNPYEQKDSNQEQNNYEQPNGSPFQPFAEFMGFNTINPEEEIDDIKAKDLSKYIGQNSMYFLPRFKQLSKSNGKAKTLNWSGFFFTGWYFIYRKMYLKGIFVVLLNAILEIPYILLMLDALKNVSPLMPNNIDTGWLTTVNMITSMIGWIIRFVCGFYATSMYKDHVYKKIADTKEKYKDENEYSEALAKKGGVATKVILGIAVAYFVLMLISMIVLLVTGG